ncbi:MAG TPA: hypothetical protein VHE35_33825 [Kofleriaceae bacterium]|nr:hypothetical protein [Kofleriaceae bacterium]
MDKSLVTRTTSRVGGGAMASSAGLLLATVVGSAACKFPYPADVTADDATSDATPAVDARHRTGALIGDHQAADFVLGAVDFMSNGNATVDARYLAAAISFSGSGDRLWAADTSVARVALYEPFPTTNDPSAAFALGRATLNETGDASSVTAANFGSLSAVQEVAGRLLVVDRARHRVLLWSTIPTEGSTPADLVLGQSTFDASAPGAGPAQLNSPFGVWSDGQRVVVADTGNNRVLIWRTFPTRNGQPADGVLGQSALDQATEPTSPEATTLLHPTSIASDGDRLVVADTGFHRILIWKRFPSSSAEPADVAVAAPNLNSEGRLSFPADPHDFGMQVGGVALFDGALFVADTYNDRVLVYDPAPEASIEDVTAGARVLGQTAPAIVVVDQPATARTLNGPSGLGVVNGYLLVGDGQNGRTLGYRLNLE